MAHSCYILICFYADICLTYRKRCDNSFLIHLCNMYIVRSPYQLSTTSLRAEGPCQCMSSTVNCQGQSLITESNPLRRGSYRYLTGTLGTIIRSQGNLCWACANRSYLSVSVNSCHCSIWRCPVQGRRFRAIWRNGIIQCSGTTFCWKRQAWRGNADTCNVNRSGRYGNITGCMNTSGNPGSDNCRTLPCCCYHSVIYPCNRTVGGIPGYCSHWIRRKECISQGIAVPFGKRKLRSIQSNMLWWCRKPGLNGLQQLGCFINPVCRSIQSSQCAVCLSIGSGETAGLWPSGTLRIGFSHHTDQLAFICGFKNLFIIVIRITAGDIRTATQGKHDTKYASVWRMACPHAYPHKYIIKSIGPAGSWTIGKLCQIRRIFISCQLIGFSCPCRCFRQNSLDTFRCIQAATVTVCNSPEIKTIAWICVIKGCDPIFA